MYNYVTYNRFYELRYFTFILTVRGNLCSAPNIVASCTFRWQTRSLTNSSLTRRFADKMARSQQRRQMHSSDELLAKWLVRDTSSSYQRNDLLTKCLVSETSSYRTLTVLYSTIRCSLCECLLPRVPRLTPRLCSCWKI